MNKNIKRNKLANEIAEKLTIAVRKKLREKGLYGGRVEDSTTFKGINRRKCSWWKK